MMSRYAMSECLHSYQMEKSQGVIIRITNTFQEDEPILHTIPFL